MVYKHIIFVSNDCRHSPKSLYIEIFCAYSLHGRRGDYNGPPRAAKKLLCCSWVWDLVAVGEGRQERNKGIFLLVCELKVAELSLGISSTDHAAKQS